MTVAGVESGGPTGMADGESLGRLAGIDRVLSAWRLSPGMHDLKEPASESTIAAAERAMGRALPDGLKALYRFSNGMEPLGGDLMLESLTAGEDTGLVGLSDRLRSWHWPIPDEVLMFGGNGGDELFGLWYPPGASAAGPTPVVMVGAIFEPASFALAGTDLLPFLFAWSGFHLVLRHAPTEALEALGLPEALREIDQAGDMSPYFRWGDPSLPDPDLDPYERGLDAAGIAELVGR